MLAVLLVSGCSESAPPHQPNAATTTIDEEAPGPSDSASPSETVPSAATPVRAGDEPEAPRVALKFADQASVELADTQGLFDVNGEFTVEVWCRWERFPSRGQTLCGDEAWAGMHAEIDAPPTSGWTLRVTPRDGALEFDFTLAAEGNQWASVLSPRLTFSDGWQHVAVSKSADEIRLFHNGRRMATRLVTERFVQGVTPIYVGVRKYPFVDRAFDGQIGGLRISSSVRYEDSFEPMVRPALDSDTLVLLDFESPTSSQISDLSRGHRHGTLAGAEVLAASVPLAVSSVEMAPPPAVSAAVVAQPPAPAVATYAVDVVPTAEQLAGHQARADEVARLFASSPQASLPMEGRDSQDTSDETADRLAGYLQQAYQTAGVRDSRWDEAVETFLARYSGQLLNLEHNPSSEHDASAEAQRVVESGCTDPLASLLAAAILARTAGLGAPQSAGIVDPVAYERCVEGAFVAGQQLMASQHTDRAKYLAISTAVRVMQTGRNTPRLSSLAAYQPVLAARAVTGAAISSAERRLLLRLITEDLRIGTAAEYVDEVRQIYAAAADVDPWLLDILAAREHLRLGWRARGSGFADSVSDAGWQAFFERLGKAQVLLLHAWKTDPHCPETADELIKVTMGLSRTHWTVSERTDQGGLAGVTERFWFDQAVAVELDYTPAYDSLAWSLRPRWGGSHLAMLNLGRECVDSGRFETIVPWYLHILAHQVSTETGDWQTLLASPDVAAGYAKLLAGYRGTAPLPAFQHQLNTMDAAVAYWMGRKEDAHKLIDDLGADADLEILSNFSLNPDQLRQD
jgi:hypothetical protein